MRAHWFRASSSVVALLLGVASAHAQDATGTAQGNVSYTPGQAPQTAAGTNAEIGQVQTRAAITPEEQLAQAAEIQRRANALAERMSKMLDEARKDKDIMRANCINRKLTEANANARNVEQRATALRNANTTNDAATRSHEYTVLTVLSQKLNSLDQEATQCLGQSVFEPGASQVITTIQAGNPTLDPTVIEPASAYPPSITIIPPNLIPRVASGSS